MGSGTVRTGVLTRTDQLAHDARTVLDGHRAAADLVREGAAAVRDAEVLRVLEQVPVARLREVTSGGVRVAALEAAGYLTVRQVHTATVEELLRVPGIGALSAAQAVAAAGQLARAAAESTPARITEGDPSGTALVLALYPFVLAGPGLAAAERAAAETSATLEALLAAARPARGSLRLWLTGRAKRAAALAAVTALEQFLGREGAEQQAEDFAQAVTDLLRVPASPAHAWLEFSTRSVEFYSVLGQLAPTGPADTASAQGHLPQGLVAQVGAEPLDVSLLKVALRGYQAFGARYALARGRTILGDEMGLGKTVQALAALAHLAAGGESHFLVVCPASVLVNWLRETEVRTELSAHRLHGPYRDIALDAWQRTGGVAVTTFESLRHLPLADPVPGAARPAMVVVDEAHYVKNPGTQRSRQVTALTGACARVLFLTGTPMENRVAEFRALLGYLQPNLLPAVDPLQALMSAPAFRHAVAPAYLRRNQSDVLSELPETLHTDEWQEFSPTDLTCYQQAVFAGNFMAMRRAAYATPAGSAKLGRLTDIVREAGHTGENVLVFSYFRDVLRTVHQHLSTALPGTRLFGPLSGNTSATARQDLVDEFTAAPRPAVLIAQIQAGGVGLNLQAASVVVLCEPQIKPALERQAVARAQRMGQIRPVRVHRLLTPDSVDQRLLAMLGRKQRLFDAYAHRSEVAETTPDAVDISHSSLVQQIIEDEQLRLADARP